METDRGVGLPACPGEQRSPASSGVWLVLAVVLLIRLPFLNQAVQGDDHQYITEATHALVDPLHPKNTKYIFLGDEVDQRGQPHPPLNAWTLAGLIALFGEVKEVPFHAAYIGWSLIAVAAMWSLARRFSPQPFWATLLFLAVPAFVVNGNSFESDLPFLALWMAAIAFFSAGRLFWAAAAMALASMAAYQAILLTPILAVYVWLFRRRDRMAWLVLLVPPLVLGTWQIFERATTGAMPAAVLNGYFQSYGLQSAVAKLRNAIALFGHSWFLVFPALVPGAIILAWRKRRDPETQFLAAWIVIFFAAALVIFFAGSARYLLPMAAPVALLASRQRGRWLAAGFGLQLALGLGLAAANYEHWDGYRQFARQMRGPTENHRVWVDGLWGIRYYFERQGALPLRKGQQVRAGEFLVSSDLGRAVDVNAPVAAVASMEIRPSIPLRIIGLETASGFSSVGRGLWPFGVSTGVIDRLHAARVVERHPTLEYLPMGAPEARDQIVSGIFALEGTLRWMSRSAVVVLKAPAGAQPLRVVFTIHPKAPARHISLLLDGREIASQTYDRPGTYTLTTAPAAAAGPVAVVSVQVDRTFTALPDTRELGIVLAGIGFVR
jgi:hypothetical protein